VEQTPIVLYCVSITGLHLTVQPNSLVLLDPGEANEENRGIRGAFKTPTTVDVTNGITDAINGALANSSVSGEAVAAVMIGTTVGANFPTLLVEVCSDIITTAFHQCRCPGR
jgi:Hydantoinase/oxoprolinase N-terminal region